MCICLGDRRPVAAKTKGKYPQIINIARGLGLPP